MFSRIEDAHLKSQFLDQAKAARDDRAARKQQEAACIKIQALVRRFLVRCKVNRDVRLEVDEMLLIPENLDAEYKPNLKPAVDTFKMIKRFWLVYKEGEDKLRFEYLCKYILLGMNLDSVKNSYASLALNKEYVMPWIAQLKMVLRNCCSFLKSLTPENTSDMRMITTCLRMLVTFTSPNNWKLLKMKAADTLKGAMCQLCNNVMGDLNEHGLYPSLQVLLMNGLARSKPIFRTTALTAIVTIALRPVLAANFSDNLLTLFLIHVLSIPALVAHVAEFSPDCMVQLIEYRVFKLSVDFLLNAQSTRIVFNTLEGNYALCLLANLIQLGFAEKEGLVENTSNFMLVVRRLLESCSKYVQSKKSNLSHWHPVLGWFAQRSDQGLHEAMPFVEKQLRQLWSVQMIRILLEQLFAYTDAHGATNDNLHGAKLEQPSKNIIKKAIEKASSSTSGSRAIGGGGAKLRLDSHIVVETCQACSMYLTAIATLTQLKSDILTGLCWQDLLLARLWKVITDLGSHCGLRAFESELAAHPNDTSHPIFQLLHLSCDMAAHVVVILDDMELYEQSKPFSLDNLISITYFLNNFIFHVIWKGYMDIQVASNNEVFNSVHSLLTVLYDRDCRKSFSPPDHWLIREVRPSAILSELEKGKKVAEFLLQKVPFIIPHKERVILFRKYVHQEKERLGLTESSTIFPHPTLVTIHRPRMIEDGYRQLSLLPPHQLKGVIRVKFINEQGLDEAGIDQDGVFKEFLEETIKRVFDPLLNLFKVTGEQKLYPSPTSSIQDNHLTLFEFVGRMLAKAVYEGIVVEVSFAPFFLSMMLGHQRGATYSSIDELPSLDPELYKSLTYIKHYKGDIGDLELTFSCDEDVIGRLVTHELVPGGRAISVTNENKISYVHLMAHFKMRVQIREQTLAFLHGFKSIINGEWLRMFSAPELQKLISGDTIDIDLQDLRSHTQYYGGFHNSHRVVSWLWDILQKDFTSQERSLFLKFVTSCSRPPLLGFANLEPPFSIRCVEVSEDQDTGDTVSSVLKGFFNIRKREPIGRLPTSSTCFNLLKLPNYQKKSTLRDKLRYAINSNTGFELS